MRLMVFAAMTLALTVPVPAQDARFTVKVPGIETEDSDTSPMVCRAPMAQTDIRLPGPRVCKTRKQWDTLHAQGRDIGADGKTIVESEKSRSLNR